MDQCTHSSTNFKSSPQNASSKVNIHERVRKLRSLIHPYGVHSSLKMTMAGFRYTGQGDTAHCGVCNLDVSDWTETMEPFTVHSERNPQCPFVLSRSPTSHSELEDQENPAKRQKTSENSYQHNPRYKLVEVNSLKQIRRRTFSHWPHQTQPSVEQMIAAGFFSCSVGDRVICIYCNLICQQWLANQDDPSEVHQTLSPRCVYVLGVLMHPEQSSTLILNDNSNVTSNNLDQQRFDQIVYTRPCHAHYSDITKRVESFATWSEQAAPSVDELVRAGFFYTGTGSALTCFYCGGSLQNWSATDNPINEHVRWFSHCPYAKQLCGDETHRRIQEANRLRQGK